MKVAIISLFFLTIVTSCNNYQKSENYYPSEVSTLDLYKKFDNAMYQMYKLNVLQSTGEGLFFSKEDTANNTAKLLNSNLFNGRIRFLGDTTIFSFLLLDQNKAVISPKYFVNCIGFVKDSIKFIEIGDGSIMEISEQKLSTFDSSFMALINTNRNPLSDQLKFVLKQNKAK